MVDKQYLIALENVTMVLGNQTVLRDVDFRVPRGQTAVVLGRSGVGKSVLLKIIVGLLKPTRGHVFFKGQDINTLPEHKRIEVQTNIGVLFQGSALFDSMTVFENVAFGLREHRKMDEQHIHKRVMDRLSLVGMAEAVEKKPAELSGGMKKRVGLARALAMDPEAVLYDEPTMGLDPVIADTINELIIRTKETFKTTSVVVTHDIAGALKVGDRMLMLHEGEFIFDGSPRQLRECADPRVARFVQGKATLE